MTDYYLRSRIWLQIGRIKHWSVDRSGKVRLEMHLREYFRLRREYEERTGKVIELPEDILKRVYERREVLSKELNEMIV